MTRLEEIAVLSTALARESGVELEHAIECVRNAMQAALYEPEPGEEPVTLEEMLVACMVHRISYAPLAWRSVARADVPHLARVTVDALHTEAA